MTGLKKELGLFDITIYGVGIILGAGIYALIGESIGITGNSIWISFLIGSLVAAFTGLSYAELASIFPKAAAEYIYINKAIGIKTLAFLIGWLIIFTGMTSTAAVSLGFGGYFNGLFSAPIIPVSILLIIILSFFNYLGIKQSSRINVLFTMIEISGLLIVIILSLLNFQGLSNIDYFSQKNGLKGIFSAAALVFFAYIGFEDIANVSEEAKKPKSILSKAFILSILITTALYVLTSIAAINLASPEELSSSKAPLALAVSKTFLGSNAYVIMSFIALFATANTVLVAMIVGSRMIYGMAKDKSLPHILSKINRKRGTPHFAILIMMIISILLLFIGEINFVANITSLGAFLTFALVNLSLIILRYKSPYLPRPFKTPLNIGKFPALAFLGLITSVFMIFNFEPSVMLYTIVVLAIGVLLHKFLK